MGQFISPIIHATELLELYQTANVIFIDATNGKNAKLNYLENHLDGALFIDLNTQLADIKEDAANGGRHPLPSIESFSKTLASLGIVNNSHVIIYDDKNGSNAAARFWWMLKSIGHQRVQVLNGGIKEAIEIGFPTNNKIVIANKVEPYKVDNWQLPIASMSEVEEVSINNNFIVIDVRDNERYKGKVETIDLVAGHIPGAINIPFSENLDDNELFLSPTELKLKYQKVFENKNTENIIVHCGSGVTACHTLLAIAYAGLEIPKLYVGSWSEWSRNNKKIATEQ